VWLDVEKIKQRKKHEDKIKKNNVVKKTSSIMRQGRSSSVA
jgi:hypothetical protein